MFFSKYPARRRHSVLATVSLALALAAGSTAALKPAATATEVLTPATTDTPSPATDVSLEIRIETSRPQPYVGSGIGITAEFKNTSKKSVLYLSSETTTLTAPPELEGPLEQIRGREAFFPTENDQYRIQQAARPGSREPMLIAIQPGRAYRAVWVLDKKADELYEAAAAKAAANALAQAAAQASSPAQAHADNTTAAHDERAWWQLGARLRTSRLWQQVSAEARYLFFVPGDYRVLVQAKVGVNEPPQLDRHRYYTVSENAIVKMAAPQTVIMLGAMLGGLVSVFLFPQSRPKSVILAYRQGGFAPALESTFGLLYSVAGACLLSAIVTVMLARLSESQFLVKISVNDFWGAVVVGFIAQYAGVSILDKLVPGRAKARQEEASTQGGAETKTKGAAPTPAGDKDDDAKP
ncbi:MAG: hypothetical protein LW854_23765 [Rubrivivax sp.]|nr:hypothetical protein [Rubrivivax sp.]